ncbi:MAG: extracellular solute-binding protein [Propionibacteriales bacterium]|nr:extracellular solute-binding protein [Propionibacteriales bacterium]
MKPCKSTGTTMRRLAAFSTLLVVVAACGGSPTGNGDNQGDGGGGAADEDAFAEVFEQLEGLEGQARTDKLVELATEEGELNIYTSNTDLDDFADEFTDEYGLEVSVYRAQANQVLQRLLQENEAGFAGADLYDTNAKELGIANSEGLLREYEGPVAETLVDAALQEGWVGSRLNLFTPTWNTERVNQPPTSYQDLADPRFEGQVLMEPRAFEWYMTLFTYFTEEEGMEPEEVDQMFADMAANSTIVEGNTEHAEFIASGEHAVSASVYNHLVDELADDGAPVSRTPAVEPVVVRPNGVGLLRSAQNPAFAVLFMEWLLTDGQELLLDEFRIPVREELQQPEIRELQTVMVDTQKLVDEGSEWEERYDELVREAQ